MQARVTAGLAQHSRGHSNLLHRHTQGGRALSALPPPHQALHNSSRIGSWAELHAQRALEDDAGGSVRGEGGLLESAAVDTERRGAVRRALLASDEPKVRCAVSFAFRC